MKIVFIIASMGHGGAERIAATLANAWSDQNHTVQFLTFDRPDAAVTYPMRSNIDVRSLDLASASTSVIGAILSNSNRVRVLRKAVHEARPDIVVSFMLETNVLTLLASIGTPWPVVISERIHPAYHPVGRVWNFLRRWLYARADIVVAQTSEIADWLTQNTGARTLVIANPIDVLAFQPFNRAKASKRKTLLAVGRLDRQKAHDVAIAAFAKASGDLPDWDFSIVGEGSERQALQRMIESLGMTGRISLVGPVSDMASAYRDADAVVHSARYEGYPNAIVEALTAGKPVIAADSPGAASELLNGGAYGVLVPAGDSDALSRAFRNILNDSEALEFLSRNAVSATAANDVSKIAPMWLELFSNLCRTRH